MVDEVDDTNNFYNCFDFEFTGNHSEDISNQKILVLFTSSLDYGYIRLVQPVKPQSRPIFAGGKYIELSDNINKNMVLLLPSDALLMKMKIRIN